MWTVNFFIVILLCLNIYANCERLSDIEQKILLTDDTTNNEAHSDIEEKKEKAKNYLSSLTKEKDNWIDPYDMIAFPMDEINSASSIKSEHVELLNEPNVELDFRPLFSDIKGEVISPNSISKDDSEDYFTKDDGNLLSNGRHQICVLDSIYISRWLKKLISKIESDSEFEPTAVTIPLDSEYLGLLKAMSIAKTLEIADLDEIMCNLIAKTTILRKEAYDSAYVSDFIMKIGIVLCFCLAAYVLYIGMTVSPGYTLVCCFFFINVFWHWMHLYQKQIAIKHYQLSTMQIPSGCEKVELGILEQIQVYIKSFFASGDCQKYYEALMVNPVWEVSLSVAVSEAVAAACFQPLYSASRALNASIKILFADLSFLHVLILVILLFMIIIMKFRYKLKFPLFMGALEPGNIMHNYVEDIISDKKPSTLNERRNKSCEILHNLTGSASNAISSVPSGSSHLCKNDTVPIFSSSVSNNLLSSSYNLIKRNSTKENDFSDLNKFNSNSRNTEETFVSDNTTNSDNYCEKSNSCSCGSEEGLTVKTTMVEKHNEFEKVFDSDMYNSHIEAEENFFDHHACAKCERHSLKRFSPNHDDCAECGKNYPQ